MPAGVARPKKVFQPRRCRIYDCVNAKNYVAKGVALPVIPSEKARFEYWVKVCGNEEFLELPLYHLKENLHICELHFKPEDFFRGPKIKRKSQKADPSIFPENHVHLTDEAIEKWRQTDAYKAYFPDSNVTDRNPTSSQVSSSSHGGSEGEQIPQVSISDKENSVPVLQKQHAARKLPTQASGHQDNQQITVDCGLSPPKGRSESFEKKSPCNVGGGDVLREKSPKSNLFSSGQLLLISQRNAQGTVELVPISCEPVVQQPPPQQLSPSREDNETLAQPLPELSPHTPKFVESPFTVKKRKRDLSSKGTAKRCRPSVATERKTIRQVADCTLGEGVEITPLKKRLCSELRRTQQQVVSLMRENDHLKALSKHTDLDLILKHVKNPELRMMVEAELKNRDRKPTGRTFTLEQKLLALAIMKRSPKAYRFLCTFFTLPSIRTLQRLLRRLPMVPGINHQVIQHAAKRLKPGCPRDNCVILMYDEMFIRKRLHYNEHTGLIEGFSDYGVRVDGNGEAHHDRREGLADHALVFQVQGLCRKYKQPVGYHFVSGTVSSEDLSALIKEYIGVLQESGFNVVATVSDQGPTNRGALKKLMSETDNGQGLAEGYFKVNGKVIFPLYDVPHLFKSLRNNFMKASYIVWDNIKAYYSDIVNAITLDTGLFKLKQMTLEQVRPKGKKKMKVKWAMKTLSRHTSTFLKTVYKLTRRRQGALYRRKNLERMNGTSIVVRDLDKLCDYTNGPSGPHEIIRNRRENVSARTNHIAVWQEMAAKMDSLEIMVYDEEKQKVVRHRPPFQDGYILTLKNMEKLWLKLHNEYGFQFLNLRQLNQDPLEHLFSVIRQHGVNSDNPTCGHFSAALKSGIVTRLTSYKSRGANTEGDDGQLLSDLKDLLKKDKARGEASNGAEQASGDIPFLMDGSGIPETRKEKQRQVLAEVLPMDELNLRMTTEEIDEELLSVADILSQGPAHVAGYIVHRILGKVNCTDCRQSLVCGSPSVRHTFTQESEYNSERPALHYASEGFCKYVEEAQESIPSLLKGKLHVANVKSAVEFELLTGQDFTWLTCNKSGHFESVSSHINSFLGRMLLHTICRRRNEKIKEEEELAKVAREAERKQSKTQIEEKKKARREKKEAALQEKERKKAAVLQLREKKKQEREKKRAEAEEVKQAKRLGRALGQPIDTSSTNVTPQRITKAERILARASNAWNVENL